MGESGPGCTCSLLVKNEPLWPESPEVWGLFVTRVWPMLTDTAGRGLLSSSVPCLRAGAERMDTGFIQHWDFAREA